MKVAADTAEFLAKGGEITEADHTANYSYRQPAKRTRKEQVNWARKFMPKG